MQPFSMANVTLSLTARQLCFRLRGGKIMFYLIRHGQADYSEKHTKSMRALESISLPYLRMASARSSVPPWIPV